MINDSVIYSSKFESQILSIELKARYEVRKTLVCKQRSSLVIV